MLYCTGPCTDCAERSCLVFIRVRRVVQRPAFASVGLKMNKSTVCITVGQRLGVKIVRSHICVCGKQSQSMDTTVCLAALALVATNGTTRSIICCVVPLLAQSHRGDSWAALLEHERHQEARWRDAGPIEEGLAPRMECDLTHSPSHAYKLATGVSGSSSGWTEVSQMFCHRFGRYFFLFAIETSRVWGEYYGTHHRNHP